MTPLRLRKNISYLPPVFTVASTRLIVNSQVKQLLTHFAKVEFSPVQIVSAWQYTCEPGDRSYELDSAHDDTAESFESIELAFSAKYRVDPPAVDLYEVIDHGHIAWRGQTPSESSPYNDRKVYKLSPTMEGRSGTECVVSKNLLQEVGIYWSGAFICDPELLDMLNPFLREYYFWVYRYNQ